MNPKNTPKQYKETRSRTRVCPSCGFSFRDSENGLQSVQAKLEKMEKERDEARNSVEQWRQLLWKTLPMEVSRLGFEQARRERDEARLRCDELKKELAQTRRELDGANMLSDRLEMLIREKDDGGDGDQ